MHRRLRILDEKKFIMNMFSKIWGTAQMSQDHSVP
jgi:hypothetical protein